VKVDVRIVAATNKDLEQAVKEGRFREDLYFRIKVVTVKLPPLRDRRDDVPLLVERFVKEFAALHGRGVTGVSNAAMAKMTAYAWPGNVRQLRNVLETAVLVTPGDTIDVANLPPEIASVETPRTFAAPAAPAAAPPDGLPHAMATSLDDLLIPLEESERILIRNALRAKLGNREQAAKALGISERTLYRKIKEYGARVTG
jgi:two-component system response regulator HydG